MSQSCSVLTRKLRGLARRIGDKRGNVAVIFALASPVVIGGAAFGVESSYWYFKDLKLQSAADAAAYAAAIEKRAGHTIDQAKTMAMTQAVANGFNSAPGSTLTLNTPPTSGPNQAADAVEVILAEPEQRFFTRLFASSTVIAKARSVARFQSAGNACVLALNPSASAAAWFAGTSDATLQGCSVMANSVAADAIKMQGSAQLQADCLISVGGVLTTGGLHMAACPAPVTQAPPVGDPFANVPAPNTSGACQSGTGATLTPGKYCGLNLNGNVTFQPGVYVISGGSFKINAGANVVGSGVTFYLTNGARIQFNGNATMNFSPPTSGDYKGLVMFGDRGDLGGLNTFNGTASSLITGGLYFPAQQVQWLGNFTGQNGCTQIVADTVQLSGNTVFNVDCTDKGMSSLPGMKLIKLVE
jgi:hypothetical protein